ncbi:MAG: leucine-rich repeat protein [Lachnospiraceae bacterium]|nr:leucine-rich repeat protein [Lachnospiraceae bacterium]
MRQSKYVKKKITAICLSLAMAGSLLLTPGKMTQVKAANGTAAEVVNLAASQVGYHEKASNANLDDFNANSGSGNYTKYARDVGVANGQAWCATFVWWLMASAGVPNSAYPSRTTVTRDWFNQRGLYRARGSYIPKAGDYVIFGNVAHCGIVESVSNGAVHTIEGNSGDKVARHQYSLNNSYILGYGIIQYNGSQIVPGGNTPSIPGTDNPGAPYPIPTTVIRSGSRGDQVKWVQKFANDVMGAGISVDGVAGNQTVYAIKVFQQQNGLTADAMAGTQTIAKMLSAWRAKLAADNTPKPVDLGTNFGACIMRSDIAKPIYNAKNNVELGDDSKQADAKWLFMKQADGSYIIQSLYDGSVLDCLRKGTTNGTNVMAYTLNGGDNQKWLIYDVGGAYKLVPKHAANLVMDVSDTGTTKGTNIKLWESNGSVAQRFSIVKENYNALQTIEFRTGYEKEMAVGTTQMLQSVLSPANTQSNMVKWESSNEKVASVDSHGVVTAKTEGKVEIKCVSTFNSNIKASATIAVVEPKTNEVATEVTTEQPTETTTEVTTECPTETTTEVTTEQLTETTTEVTTERSTEETTEVTTEQPTEVTTEVMAEPTTETDTLDEDISENGSEDTIDIEFPMEEGNQFEQNGLLYEVISDDEDDQEVCLVECNKTVKSLVVPEQVQKEGIVYTVTAIEDYAFEGDRSLTTVTIGNKIEIIGEAAFMNCKNLKTVSLGNGLTTIEKKAFYNCKKLRKLNIYSSDIQKIGKKAFAKTSKKLTVKIPANKKRIYKKLLRKAGLR